MRYHRFRLTVVVLLIVSLFLAACGPSTQATPTQSVPSPAPSTAVSPNTTPQPPAARFEEGDCPFDVPAGQEARCGYLVVPEDRSQPAGKTIRLAVAIFRSQSDDPAPDPIVYLEGGPGGSPLRAEIPYFDLVFAPFLEKRDLILFDQRGTGYSEPALDCPEYNDVALDVLDENLRAEQEQVMADQALRKCRDRLVAEGVTLAAYTSAENAADLNDLRLALGYSEWNLYGVSYGTRLALTEMRDFPTGIRSAVLDSVFPPQVDLIVDTPANTARALNLLFDSCAADATCNAAYPDLRRTFFDVVDQLNITPAAMTLTVPSGERVPGLLNGDRLIGIIFQSLYATPLIPMLPQIIYQAHEGNFAAIGAVDSELLKSLQEVSQGMYYSVQCAEDVPFGTPAELDAALAAYPELRAAYGGDAADDIFALCQAWGSRPPDPIENQPVHSDIPTLILSGQYDPVTPPAWGQLAAQTLPHSFFFELPGAGHGASLVAECPRTILLNFVDSPTTQPTTSCIQEEMSQFAFLVPVNAADISLVPFEDAQLGIRGLRPEGWKEVSVGTYTPKGLATDQTAIVQLAAPLSADQFLELLREQLAAQGIDVPSESAGSRQAKGLTWKLYRIDAKLATVDIALAESEGLTYVIMLQSLLGDHEALYGSVFLPCIDALEPLQ